jgi:hypothetical protein
MNNIKLSYDGLNKKIQRKVTSNNNFIYHFVPINLKMTLQEQQKILDTSLAGKNYLVENTITIRNTDIKLIDGFTGKCEVEYYLDILDIIDNMILLEFIKTRILFDKNELYDYSITENINITIDILLAYYVIKYPEDSSVNETKLKDLRIELQEKLK